MTPEQLAALKRLPVSAVPRGTSTVDPATGRIIQEKGGVTSEYYPTATGGKLDLFSKTVAAGPVEAAENSPYQVLDQQFNSLRRFTQDQLDKLDARNLPEEQYNQIMAGMQADYDQQKFKISNMRSQLDTIRQDRTIAPELKNEAMWRMVLPPEHAAAMFPKQVAEPRGRMTPGEAVAYKKSFKEAIKPAYSAPYFGSNLYDSEKLKEIYFAERDKAGYGDQMNAAEQRGFDAAWDELLDSSKAGKKAWNPDDPDILSSRTYDQRLLNIAAGKMTGKRVSPFAQGMSKSVEPKTLDKVTAAAILKEAGGDKNKARQIARERGYSL